MLVLIVIILVAMRGYLLQMRHEWEQQARLSPLKRVFLSLILPLWSQCCNLMSLVDSGWCELRNKCYAINILILISVLFLNFNVPQLQKVMNVITCHKCLKIWALFRPNDVMNVAMNFIKWMIELDWVGIQHCLGAKNMIKENEIKILRQNEAQTGIWVYWMNLSIALYGYLVVIILCMIVWTKDVMNGQSKMWLMLGVERLGDHQHCKTFNYICGII